MKNTDTLKSPLSLFVPQWPRQHHVYCSADHICDTVSIMPRLSLVVTVLVTLTPTIWALPWHSSGFLPLPPTQSPGTSLLQGFWQAIGWRIGQSWATSSSPVAGLEFDPFAFTCCDVSQASLPAVAPAAALPAPTGTLALVAIGRGTQNFTCDPSNATAVPFAVGAIASLYNASCLAAQVPALLSLVPDIVLQDPLPTSDNTMAPLVPFGLARVGRHYFPNATTPTFELDLLGTLSLHKNVSVPAPVGAALGEGGMGSGSVAWLQLVAGGTGIKQVYRVNTAGGSAPAVCRGQMESFQVQYAAEYWFYA